MKKTVVLILALLLALCAVGAVAETCEHETYQEIQSEEYEYTSVDELPFTYPARQGDEKPN